MRQMFRVLSHLTSGNVLAQPSALFSVGLLRTKFDVGIFCFKVYGNMVEENIMYQELQKKIVGRKFVA